jgi:catechol-2,3-dioxygenase
MPFQGVSHVAITVTDLAVSKEWYGRVLGWQPVMEGSGDGVVFSLGALPGGPMIGLRQYDKGSGKAFDPNQTGLDHLAFAATSRDELPDWERRFAELDVTFVPTQNEPYGHVLNFKDPDGIALEIFAPPDDAA